VTDPHPLVQAQDIGRRVPRGDRWLLRDIHLQIQPGCRYALAGPSGSGKTLLLRALAKLDPTDTGHLLWNGIAVGGPIVPSFRRHVMYLHQRPSMLEGTVEANLRQPFRLRVYQGEHFDRSRIEAWLEQLDRPASFLDKRHRDLSGGEAQIVSLLRAIQLEPQVLLLDEPTSALDPETAGRAERLIESWLGQQAQRRSVVWVSHNRQQTERVADRVFHVRNGRLVPGDT
jgi:putative ABC transport system ATP-binding protein